MGKEEMKVSMSGAHKFVIEHDDGSFTEHWTGAGSCGWRSHKVPEPYFDFVDCKLPCDHGECGIAIRHRLGELDDTGNEILVGVKI